MTDHRPFDFDLARAAFIVVDMQNDFVREGAPLLVPDALGTGDPIKNVIALFRRGGRPVVFTRFLAGPQETDLWKWSPELRDPICCCRPGFSRYYPDLGAERSCIDVIDELAPAPGDYIVDKYRYGAFQRTNLYDILQVEGVSSVVVAGTVTQICVEETARGAFDEGFQSILLRDGVSSFDPALQAAVLKNFAMKFGRVMDSRELAAEARARP